MVTSHEEIDNNPIICDKCFKTFKTNSEYLVHVDKEHRGDKY